jgi:hypothetical protein
MKNQKFSHKTPHLKGKQHQLDPNLDLKQLVHHATVQYVDRDADGDVDVYDNPKKAIPDENVSSAADAEKFSKKLIAKQKGEIKHTKVGMAYEQTKSGDSSLRDWFTKSRSSDGTPGWVQLGGKYAGKPCAKQPGQTTKPKCGSSKMKANLSDDEEQKAFRRKNQEDPNPDRKGEAKMVATEEKDACYKKVKSRYKIWPSAYASGALVKCRKVGASNWGNKSEGFEYSNWRDDFKATEYEFIDLIKPNPIKMDSLQEKAMHTHEGNEEERYCPLCKKRETRSECSYGEKAWDRVSVKDEEYSMVRSEISTIEDAVKRLRAKVAKGEGNLEAWVQSKITKAADYIDTAADYVQGGEMDEECWSGYKQVGMKKKGKKTVPNCVPEETVTEGMRLPADNGNLMMVIAMWKGKSYSLKMFFPQLKVPSKKEVEEQIQKVYPGARVIYSRVCEQEPGQPFLYVNGDRGSFGPNKNYVKPMGEEVEVDEDWQKVNRQDKTDGLSQKAVNAYRRENPGSKLQTAVTEKNPEGKRASRRKSFCSRMKGMKKRLTSAETARDPDSRINKALRRWRCN